MEVGVVKVAEDKDFERLKCLVDNHSGWKLDYSKGVTKVWTKSAEGTSFKMVKLKTIFSNVQASEMYDVLHDPEYRKVWDQHMVEAFDIGCLNPNNDVGYYALSCPSPIRNRDFVLQRSWLETGQEYMILNHSVYHCDYPQKKGFIRATSYITGFVVRPHGDEGCELGYVTHSDPRGDLPSVLVNKLTQIFAPKMVKKMQKASAGYKAWKQQNRPYWKPWIYPEQMPEKRLTVEEDLKESSVLKDCTRRVTKLRAHNCRLSTPK